MRWCVIVALGALLAGPSYGQRLNLVLDRVPVMAGAGIGGFVEIAPSGSSGLSLEATLCPVSGDLSFFVTTPSGKQHEVSKRTSGEIRSGARGRRVLVYPYTFRMPLFLVSWRDTLLFEDSGKYQIVARLDVRGAAGTIADTVSLDVSAPGDGFEAWRATILSWLPNCVTAFCMSGAGPSEMASRAIGAGSTYTPALEYLSAYQFGHGIVPWLLRKPWRVPDPTDCRGTRTEVEAALAQGRTLAGHGTAIEQLLPYAQALADMNEDEAASMSAAQVTGSIWVKD